MNPRIAWRNLWRNRRRSAIVLASVAVGTVAVVLNDGLSVGMIGQVFENQIGSYVSDIQVHRKGFRDNPAIGDLVPDPGRVRDVLGRTPGVKAWTERVVTFGLLSSATASSGINLVGVDPVSEPSVTTARKWSFEGRYLTGGPREIVIGRKLAEKLDVRPGDRVVAMASAVGGEIGSAMFRVAGVFSTVSSEFDRAYAFVPIGSAREMLGCEGGVSEFAMVVADRASAPVVAGSIAASLGDRCEALSYVDLLPLMVAQTEVYRESIYIVYVIIGLAMFFGIVNTMLMSVYERVREFGVLMAVGMGSRALFAMVITEALMLGLLGTLAGIAASVAVLLPLSSSGLDLSRFAEGLTSFGSGSVVYPVLSPVTVAETLLIIPLFAVLGALYPAARAARLQPVRAIRHV